MFLTSFNVYFVFGYAFVCVYVLNCYLAFLRQGLAFFGKDKLASRRIT